MHKNNHLKINKLKNKLKKLKKKVAKTKNS
jgi:hypothetical protein